MAQTRENTEKEEKKDYRSILDYYRICRGLTITELADMSGLKRQMVSELCDGEIIKPKYIHRLAETLHVKTGDLNQKHNQDEVLNNRVPIADLTAQLDEIVDHLKPCQLKGKSRWIAAYLATEDENLQEIVDYLLRDANDTGLLILHQYLLERFKEPGGEIPDIPKPYGKKNERNYYLAAADEREPMTNLARYMKYRGKNIDQVASGTGLTRQTVGAARNGKKILSKKNLAKVAEYLGVDCSDLTEDGRGWVPVSLEKENLHRAVNMCFPRNLERKFDHVRRWLEDWREDIDPDYELLIGILEFILGETDEERQREIVKSLLNIRNQSMFKKYMRKNRSPLMEAGYQAVEGSEGEYEVFVLFDPWVYAVFGVDRHVDKLHIEEQAMKFWKGEKKGNYMSIDMPISCCMKGKDYTKKDLEGAVLDAIYNYLYELEVNPERQGLYQRWLEEILELKLNDCEVNEFIDEDSLQKICRKRICNIRYEHVLRKLYQETVGRSKTGEKEEDMDLFISMAADLFSDIVTKPNEEEERLSKYLN